MALSVSVSPELNLPTTLEASAEQGDFSNDAFAFWKLPVECRVPLAGSLAASERVISRYLFEEYLSPREHHASPALSFYYLIKGLIPLGLRHHLNALAIRARKRLDFPRWPCETALVDFWRDWLRQSLQRLGIADTLHIGFWPHDHRCCIVLTHDVESPFGFEQIQRMTDLEEQYGFRSALNFPLNQYRIDWRKLDDLKARGFGLEPMGSRTTAACSAANTTSARSPRSWSDSLTSRVWSAFDRHRPYAMSNGSSG